MNAANAWSAVAWAQLWQVTAVVVVVAVVTWLAARNRPYLAHALWLVVLLKCVTPPLLASPAGVFCWIQPCLMNQAAEAVRADAAPSNDNQPRDARILSASVRTKRRSLAEALRDSGQSWDGSAKDLVPAGVELAATTTRGDNVWLWVLAGVWATGTLGVFAVTGFWFIAGLRRLRRDGCRVDRRLQRLTASLARRLGLRRRVRLVVTESRIGPAVFGLVRPTVLLPEMIVRGRALDELEPILAHELIHVRRGDLWVGLLQTVAQAVWWFHPGVWWAGQLIYRDAERCCDEAVVAELRCRPSHYARSLLKVLERKQDLIPLPSLPGVRPVELTSKRMERIMRLGQGCRRRSPWWCWAAMLLAAAVVLPGAARMVAADDAETQDEPKPLQPDIRMAARDKTRPIGQPTAALPVRPEEPNRDRKEAAPRPVDASSRVTFSFMVADLIKAMQEEFNLSKAEVHKRIEAVLAGTALAVGDGPVLPPATEHVDFLWSDDGRVFVIGPDKARQRIAEAIETMRTRGLSQITMEVRFVTAPSSVVDAAGVEWTSRFGTASPDEVAKVPHSPEFAARNEPPSPRDRARTVREKSYPIRMAKLDAKDISSLTARLFELEPRQYQERETLGDRVQRALGYQTRTAASRQRVNVLQAPLITLFDGQEGVVRDCSFSPFVSDFKTEAGENGVVRQPVIMVLAEGTIIKLRARLADDRRVVLTCSAMFSHIGDVNTMTTKPTDGSEPVTIQVPEHEVTEILTNVELATGRTILIDGPRTEDEHGQLISSLVMVTPTEAILARKQSKTQTTALADATTHRSKAKSRLYVVTYDVGDLVVPIPDFVDVLPRENAALKAEARKNMKPDFKPLIDLVTSTVKPASWTIVGGQGTIQPYENNLTLLVKQTEKVHNEITDLLAQLHRANDIQVTLDVRRIDMAGDVFDRLGIELDAKHRQTILNPREARLFWALAGRQDKGDVLRLPRVTCFNGQQARFGLVENQSRNAGSDAMLFVQSVVDMSPDRKTLRLTTGLLGEITGLTYFGPDGMPTTFIQDDQTLLVDLTGLVPGKSPKPGSKRRKASPPDAADQRVFVSITPTVIVQEEEEVRIAPPIRSAAAKARESVVDLGMVKAQVIIQEEEEGRIQAGPAGP